MFVELYITFLRKFSGGRSGSSGARRTSMEKNPEENESWFPWKTLLLLFLITFVALIGQDVSHRGSLQDSKTGKVLKDLGVLGPVDKVWRQSSKKLREMAKWGRKEWPKVYKNWYKESKAVYKKYNRKGARHFEYFTHQIDELLPGAGSLLFSVGHGVKYIVCTVVETSVGVVYSAVTIVIYSVYQTALIVWHVASNTIGAQEAFKDMASFGGYAYSQVLKNVRSSIDAIRAMLA